MFTFIDVPSPVQSASSDHKHHLWLLVPHLYSSLVVHIRAVAMGHSYIWYCRGGADHRGDNATMTPALTKVHSASMSVQVNRRHTQ